jgi:hypothetical protein
VPQQFATIQAAIDASFAGDIIRVAPGTYSQSLTFANRPDRAVVGIGKVLLDVPAAIDAITITNSSYVRLENLRIRGGTDDGIEVDALSESVKLRKLVIEACGDDGIVSAGDAGWIENVTVRDCDDAGVFVSGDAVYLANVAVKQVGGRGIIVAGARNIVTRSKVDTSGADGIVVLGSESMNLVSECDTRSCDGHSLWIAAATSDNLVRDSRARDSASTGLKAQGLGSVVIGNKVRDATSIGIDCAGPAIAVANEVKNTKGGRGVSDRVDVRRRHPCEQQAVEVGGRWRPDRRHGDRQPDRAQHVEGRQGRLRHQRRVQRSKRAARQLGEEARPLTER